jgi:hypothetical protein
MFTNFTVALEKKTYSEFATNIFITACTLQLAKFLFASAVAVNEGKKSVKELQK